MPKPGGKPIIWIIVVAWMIGKILVCTFTGAVLFQTTDTVKFGSSVYGLITGFLMVLS